MDKYLSEETQGLFTLATKLSAQLKHYYIGVEHIFVACVKLDRPFMAAALQIGGVSLDRVMGQLGEIMSHAPALPTQQGISLTPRLSRLIDAARQAGSGEATLALLLPLLFREGRSLPCYLIRQLEGDLEAIAAHLEASPIATSPEAQERLAQARIPALSALGRDLTRLAAEDKLDPVIGRDREIRQMAMVLARKAKNNPVLIGEAGVGKTAVAEGLALRIAAGQVPPSLRDKRIIELPISVIVAGTQYRGQFEERLNQVINEVRQNPDIILFIDELHTLIGAGGGSGVLDAANILKPALARGDLRCIGATTVEEYHRYIEPDAALERRFSPVMVRELSLEATLSVLEGRRDSYERHHGVQITSEALQTVVRLAMRHVPERRMPDKALDLLDEACARASMALYLDETQTGWLTEVDAADGSIPEVTPQDVADVLADRTGIPLAHLLANETTALANLEAVLAEEVIGQEAAIGQVVNLLRRLRSSPNGGAPRPATMIFAGPLGVGKRSLTLALATALFHNDAVVAFDLAEFKDKMDVEKMLGAPPGYIGHDRESLLSRRLRRDPYTVITLEHFDAAYPDVQELFWRGLREGWINDNQGHTIHLENAIVVILMNLAEETGGSRRPMGFAAAGHNPPLLDENTLLTQIRKQLGTELVETVDELIYFPPLDEKALTILARRGLDGLTANSVVFTENVINWLAVEATTSGTGQRALERLIRVEVAAPVQEALKATPPGIGEVLFVDYKDGQLDFSLITQPT
ncbi:MAG: ATP-dependent Clp protease ATP-binding subunit [Anaerolineaceae bacterium]|nr:ATP-dependent Clp protease ATP-binding subunit [Anaerolineaceae bacterium]